MPDEPEDVRRAKARYRAFLTARTVAPGPNAITTVAVAHAEAESHYLRRHPGDEPHRAALRTVGADWGYRLLLRADWEAM